MTMYLMKLPPTKVLPSGREVQLEVDENGELRDPDEAPKDYFTFGSFVGRDSPNRREDVLRAQTLLGHAGYFDMEHTEGPTGWYGKPLELGIRKFQKDNGLTVDGYMEPGGETLTALQEKIGTVFGRHRPPSLKLIDEHHERRARGEPGLLNTEHGKGTPFGVPLLATPDMGNAAREHSVMRKAEEMRREPFGSALAGDEIQLASAAPGTMKAQRDPITRSWPEGGPIVMGGGGPRGGAGAAKNVGRALDGVTQLPDRDDIKASPATATAALLDGIASGFGKVERHETDNTRKSSNIIVQECNKVIEARAIKGVTHKAGATPGGLGGEDLAEKAIKDGKLEGGGGHNFPDVLYLDKNGTIIAINSATEAGPDEFIAREIRAFNRMLTNVGQGIAKMIGKMRIGEDEDKYRERAREVCEEAFDDYMEKELERVRKQQQSQDIDPPSPQ